MTTSSKKMSNEEYFKIVFETEAHINKLEKAYNASTSREQKQINFMNSEFCLYELCE